MVKKTLGGDTCFFKWDLVQVTFLPKSAKSQCAFVSVTSLGKSWVFCCVCEVLHLTGR